MTNMPGAMIVVDINREAIAVREANRVGIPVVAFVDTNCDPDPINYPIPANDDSIRSIKLIINALTDAILKAGAEYTQVRANEQQNQPTEPKAGEQSKPSGRPFREKRTHRGTMTRGRPVERKEPKSFEKKEEEKKEPVILKPETPAPAPEGGQ